VQPLRVSLVHIPPPPSFAGSAKTSISVSVKKRLVSKLDALIKAVMFAVALLLAGQVSFAVNSTPVISMILTVRGDLK